MTQFFYYNGTQKFTKEQQSFFDEVEKAIERPLVVVNGQENPYPQLPPEAEADAFVIWDFICPQGYIHTPQEKGHFGGPKPETSFKLKKHRWLYRFSQQVPQDVGQRWRFPGRTFVLGMWRYNELYTSFSLTNLSKSDLKDFKIMDVIKQASDKEAYDKQFEEEVEKMLNRATTEFETAANAEEQQINNRIQNLENELGQLNTTIIQRTRQIRQEGLKLANNKKVRDEEAGRILSQLKELQNNIHVERMTFEEGWLSVFTHQLYLYSPSGKERVPLGKFRIRLSTNGGVQMQNMTNAKGSPAKPHPHINTGGEPCWGGSQAQVGKLIAQFELVGFFETAISYLEQYNPDDDYGRFAPYWFDSQPVQHQQEDGSYLTDEEVKIIAERAEQNKDGEDAASSTVDENAPATTSV